ncbi:transcriptional regulator, TetR family [Acinetobacter sp. AR_0276]|nr:transcriptional regulator, TetR family [Acinetobacter sp. AR_0276]
MQEQIILVETKAKNLRSALTEIGKTYLCFIYRIRVWHSLESVLQKP